MATPTFFHAELDREDIDIQLRASEAAHARNSRRLKVGDTICLLNGKGMIANCTISESHRDKLFVKVDEINEQPARNPKITVAVAIPKGDRQRTMIDMLTQLGVAQIIALDCEYSATVARPKLLQKWQRVAIEACKQSQNPWLPQLDKNFTVRELIEWLANEEACCTVFADAAGSTTVEIPLSTPNIVVLVGPEGGFSVQELELFNQAGLIPMTLAADILRTETAAVVAVAKLQNR